MLQVKWKSAKNYGMNFRIGMSPCNMSKIMTDVKPKRGEIWIVNLDPTVGKEIKKTRPCLVMQSDLINETLRTTMVAPITSTVKEDWLFAIVLEKGEGGLKNKSMVLFNQI